MSSVDMFIIIFLPAASNCNYNYKIATTLKVRSIMGIHLFTDTPIKTKSVNGYSQILPINIVHVRRT